MRKSIIAMFLILGLFLLGLGTLWLLPESIQEKYPKFLTDALVHMNTYGTMATDESEKYISLKIYLGPDALPWASIIAGGIMIFLTILLIFVVSWAKKLIFILLILSGLGFSIFSGINTNWASIGSISMFGVPLAVTGISSVGLLMLLKKK